MLEHIVLDTDFTHALIELVVVDTISDGPKRSAVVRATGMSYAELDEFLKTKGFTHQGSRISTKAIPELKKWYAGKCRQDATLCAKCPGLDIGTR